MQGRPTRRPCSSSCSSMATPICHSIPLAPKARKDLQFASQLLVVCEHYTPRDDGPRLFSQVNERGRGRDRHSLCLGVVVEDDLYSLPSRKLYASINNLVPHHAFRPPLQRGDDTPAGNLTGDASQPISIRFDPDPPLLLVNRRLPLNPLPNTKALRDIVRSVPPWPL